MAPATLAELEEQVRFFKAAYGTLEGTPQDVVRASLTVLDLGRQNDITHPDVRLMLRHVIEQGKRYETQRARAQKLHEALLNVSQVVANALQLAASTDRQGPPAWLRSLGSNLDMVLADAALEKR